MPSIVRRESKETERQSIVRLSREAEAEAEAQNGSEIGHTEPTRSAADSSASSSLSKQVESNGPLFSSDSSSDESDYSTPADGGGGAYPPNWKVSVKRILGARVYARYENGEWYWGNIVRVQGSYREGNLRFGVLFEDGDNLEDLEANHMITEREYINEKREGKDRWPPHPKPKRRKLRRLLDEANGKQPMAEGNDKMAAAGLATSPATNVTSPAMSVTAAILRSNWTGSPRAKKQRLDSESNANATATPMDIKGVLRTPSMAGQSNRPGARSDSKVNGALDASSSHFLVGKDYAFEWTDVWGENKILYGKIMKRADIDSFEVKYSDASRNVLLLMSKKSVFGLPPIIPESEIIKEDQAWGGAACFERKILFRRGPDSVLRNLTREKACTTVIVPDTRHQKLVEYNGMKVPEVTLTVRGFKLVFSVKQSTIPGAGLGVFVKCTSFRKKEGNATDEVPETFELMKGELLVSEVRRTGGWRLTCTAYDLNTNFIQHFIYILSSLLTNTSRISACTLHWPPLIRSTSMSSTAKRMPSQCESSNTASTAPMISTYLTSQTIKPGSPTTQPVATSLCMLTKLSWAQIQFMPRTTQKATSTTCLAYDMMVTGKRT